LDDRLVSPERDFSRAPESPEVEVSPPPPPPLVAAPTTPVAAFVASTPVAPDVALIWLVTTVVWPVRSEATVVCDAMVDSAPVTVPTGSMPPATAALLKPPQSASTTRKVIRTAAALPVLI
jgi:hypothetical protein